MDSKNHHSHTTVCETALRLLLLFYRAQTESLPKVRDFLINFKDVNFTHFEVDEYGNTDPFYNAVTHSAHNASTLYSAFNYLKDKNIMEFTTNKTLSGSVTLHNFRITANGIDIVESGNNKRGGRKKLIQNFNLNLNFTLNLDSIFKMNLADLSNFLP